MNSIHLEATIAEDGTLILEKLPLPAGQRVTVTIMPLQADVEFDPRYPLRGTVLRYDDPFGPACPLEDWEALN